MKTIMSSFDEIIFTGRNKDYGAFDNRKNYNKNMIRAIFFGTTLFLMGISVPLIANYINKSIVLKETIVYEYENLNIPKKEDNKIKLPELQEEKLEKKAAFVAPKIVTDTTEITNDNFADLKDNVENKNIGDTNKGIVVDIEVKDKIIQIDNKPEPYIIVEEMPQYPGGDAERLKFLKSNLIYPETAKSVGIEGTVYTQFTINETGKIIDIVLLRGIGGGCDEEALRVIKKMPDWIPGKQNGVKVSVRCNMEIIFRLIK